MKDILNKLSRKHTGVSFQIFDVENIELTPLSENLDEKTFTRTIKVKANGQWTEIILFGKDRESTKIKEVNIWEG